jgi:hypothetical protein
MKLSRILENFLIPLIISSSVFLFLPSHNYYIFGQDSLPFFGQFTFYQNPLYAFNNGIEMAYFSILSEFIIHILSNVILSQHILILIATYLSTVGFFDLIDVITQLSNKVNRIISKSLGAMLFLYNPFTLSVTWWHFEGWSLLILLSPFIISFLTDAIYNGGSLKRFSLTALLTMVFVGGIMGGVYPVFLLIVGVFLIFPIYYIITNFHNRPLFLSMVRRIFYIVAFVVVATLWAFVPLYLATFTSIEAPLKGSYLLNFFFSESATTSLPHVLSMTGFSWTYDVPNAYPWIGIFPAIQATAFLLLLFLSVTPLILKKYNKLTPLILVSLLAIIFSTGSNFPFGIINKNLLLLKGPFLFLINSYYWVLQFYVLFLSILLSLVFYRSISLEKSPYNSAIKRKFRYLVRDLKGNYLKVITVILILLILATFFYPFATDQVYQKSGTNIDAIDVNNGILQLKSYLQQNYTTPDYYSLLIPTSSGIVSFTYNDNSSFVDSRGLLATADPYPLIWLDDSYLAKSVENYLSSGNLENMGGVLTYLHIRYIIFTKNYNSADAYMQESPNGNHYNFSAICKALNSSFGAPVKFGNYSVFFNRNAKPIIELIDNPIFVNSPLTNYLDFLGSINPLTLSDQQKHVLYNAVLSNTSLNTNNLTIIKVHPQDNYEVNSSHSLLMIGNGNLESPADVGYTSYKGNVSIHPIPIVSLFNRTSYFSNMNLTEGELFSSYPSYIIVNKTIPATSIFNLIFKVSNFTYGSRNYLNFQFGNITISMQFINLSNNGSPSILSFTANSIGEKPYAWENIFLPANISGRKISLSVEDYPNDSMKVNVDLKSLRFDTSAYFYFGPDNYYADPGVDRSNFPTNTSFPSQYRFEFSSGGVFPISIYNFMIQSSPEYIIVENTSVMPTIQNSKIGITMFGDYDMSAISTQNSTYLYFFGPPEGNWNAYIQGSSTKPLMVDNNGFAIVYHIPPGLNDISLQIEDQSLVPQMFLLSLIEFAVLIAVLIGSFVYEINRNRRHTSKNKG